MEVERHSLGVCGSSSSSPSQVVVVYLHCVIHLEAKEFWYRVELPLTSSHDKTNKRKRKHDINLRLLPVGVMDTSNYGYGGRWTVIGKDIYWIAGFNSGSYRQPKTLNKVLHKLNIKHSEPSSWKPVSSMNISRIAPFLASFANQICVISGKSFRTISELKSHTYVHTQCGEMYDIKRKEWDFISFDYKDISGYALYCQIVQNVDKPNEIVFYSLTLGSMLVLDLANNKECISKGPLYLNEFDLWERSIPPEGLIGTDLATLIYLTANVRPVLSDGIFYWCTNVDFQIYGYDTVDQKWLHSRSLKKYLPDIVFDMDDDPQYPLLLGIGNRKLVLVVAVDRGHSIMTIITVKKRGDKRGNSLTVYLDQLHHIYFDEPGFLPEDGNAMLKNTGSGSTH